MSAPRRPVVYLQNDTVWIFLTKDKVAIIDRCDSAIVASNWSATKSPTNKTYYAEGSVSGVRTKMHQYVARRMGIRARPDHINGDGLDNRRCNLRPATRSQNGINRDRQTNNTSGYKGIHWFGRTRKWMAYIGLNGKNVHLGYFSNLADAVAAREKAESELHGEFARKP